MRTALAIRRQLAAVKAAIEAEPNADPNDAYEWGHVTGMQQALAWVLELDAAAPRKCLALGLGRGRGA